MIKTLMISWAYYGKLEEWSLFRTNAVGMDSVAKLSGIKRY
jgi:hypothetical protein